MYETKGLVLDAFSLGETDKIACLLTLDHGVIRGIARGARRLKSRFSGSLELFSEVNVSFFKKQDKELVSFNQIELSKSYFHIISSPENFPFFSYFARVLLELVPEWETDDRFYRMMRSCLDNAEKYPNRLAEIALYFEFWSLKLAGYMPSLSLCGICKQKSDVIVGFDIKTNQFVCSACYSSVNLPLGREGKKLLALAKKLPLEDFLVILKEDDLIDGVSMVREALGKLLKMVLERELRVEKF
jgi:DNA repair protein RecO (recombination protein O)